jgi:solute carrier family 45, member 1/2/4
MLFYSTIYVGDLYKRSLPPATTDQQQTIINDEATRLGSRALFYAALLSLITSLVLPVFVAEAAGHPPQKRSSSWWRQACRVPKGMQVHLVTMWATSQLVFAGCMFATLCVTSFSFKLHCNSLLDASFYSFTHSVWGSTFIITVTGFSSAIGSWAPFSLVSYHRPYGLILHLNLF